MNKIDHVLEDHNKTSNPSNQPTRRCKVGCTKGPIITDVVSGKTICGACGKILEERQFGTVLEFC